MNKQLEPIDSMRNRTKEKCDGSIFCLRIESSSHQDHCLSTDRVFECYTRNGSQPKIGPVEGYLWSGAGKPVQLSAYRMLTCISPHANSPKAYQEGLETIFVVTAERDGLPLVAANTLVPIRKSQPHILKAHFNYQRGANAAKVKHFTLSSIQRKRSEYTGPCAEELACTEYMEAIKDYNAELGVALVKDPELGYVLRYSCVSW